MASPLTIKKKEFSNLILSRVEKMNCSHIDAVLGICEELDIDPSVVKRLIEKPIQDMIVQEFASKNLIRDKGSVSGLFFGGETKNDTD